MALIFSIENIFHLGVMRLPSGKRNAWNSIHWLQYKAEGIIVYNYNAAKIL